MLRSKQVIVIGAGITGLTAAFRLMQQGFAVTVIEASEHLGGLAGSLAIGQSMVERYYHFICRGDDDLLSLAEELGLSGHVHWREAKTSFFVKGRTYPFVTPMDLLRFDPIPSTQRIRLGLHAVVSQHRRNWHGLDRIPATDWLIRNVGREAYLAVWDPLLRIKFGRFQEQISAAWIWHRIHRVARSRDGLLKGNTYGYFERGCSMLVDALMDRLTGFPSFRIMRGRIVTSIEVQGSKVVGVKIGSQGQFLPADAVVSTAAIPRFLDIAPAMGEYTARLSDIDYLNVVCMLFELDRPFTDSFWLNINDPAISFNGIVEITNLSPRPDLGGSSLAYIPFYLHEEDPRWTYTDLQLYDEYTTAMQRIRKDFDSSWIRNWWVCRDFHAQAVCRVGFRDAMPDHETPIEGLFITDSSQYYPEDRTVSASIRLGRTVSNVVAQKHAS